MADIIGRDDCRECDFASAHIKQTPGKLPYRHCPNCGFMVHSRSREQAAYLTRRMRAVDEAAPPKPATAPPAAAAPAPTQAPTAAPAVKPRRAGIFDTLLGASNG